MPVACTVTVSPLATRGAPSGTAATVIFFVFSPLISVHCAAARLAAHGRNATNQVTRMMAVCGCVRRVATTAHGCVRRVGTTAHGCVRRVGTTAHGCVRRVGTLARGS